jgi:LCP family protein required for cell wall assembly
LVAFFVAACITAVVAFFWARSFFASGSMTPLPFSGAPSVSSGGEKGNKNTGKNAQAPSGPLQRETDPTPVPWDGASRVTLLFMGLDYRDWSEGMDIPRTDSMILFSVDPVSKTAGMVSIPRDLWVNIPEVSYNKINTAYRWGEMNKFPGGGPGLAMKTVEETLGVPVDYYAMIDFNSFVKFIDELGGLDMKIREEIVIDPIGPGNTRTLEPGTQTLTGAEVLAYARNRYTANDDFDRSRRQQEVIMAMRKQILQFNMLPTLVSKAPKLYQELSSGISTNLTLDQVVKLALLASQIDEKNIQKGVIGPPTQVVISTNPEDGQSILVPVPDQIRILRDRVFATGGPVAPSAVEDGDPVQLMKAEKARVAVKNGTTTTGLATKASDMLRGLGINIVGEDNADKRYGSTTIYDYSGKPYTIKFLIQKLNIPESRVVNRFDPQAPADIEIILGSDWARQQ